MTSWRLWSASDSLLTLGATGTTFAEAIDPTELLVGTMLVATGFVAGLLAEIYLRDFFEHHIARKREDRFHFSDVLIADFPSDKWDPSHVNPQPSTAELASREEHVIRLLIANDGRIRQSSLIAETGWSQAKVSRLLQDMEEKGDISRIHVGRHNLVVLGRFPPGATGSSEFGEA